MSLWSGTVCSCATSSLAGDAVSCHPWLDWWLLLRTPSGV